MERRTPSSACGGARCLAGSCWAPRSPDEGVRGSTSYTPCLCGQSSMHQEPPEPQPSAARNIYAFGITSFLNDTATEMAYWVLPAFLVSLGAGPAQLGLIEGIAESVASFAKLFSGYLT